VSELVALLKLVAGAVVGYLVALHRRIGTVFPGTTVSSWLRCSGDRFRRYYLGEQLRTASRNGGDVLILFMLCAGVLV
jgi:hypothetical protein